MNLVYETDGKLVKVGDKCRLRDGEEVTIEYFRKPDTSNSSGKVSVSAEGCDFQREYYVSIIGAHWVNREDQVGWC